MKKIFDKLYHLKKLTTLESQYLFNKILNNHVTQIELSAILTIFKIRKPHTEEILGAIKSFQKVAIPFPKPKYLFADICGTGGDGVNTINISTMSAITASSLGFKIIKHCNTGVSSVLGSSDILEKMNINIHLNSLKSKKILDDLNICFLFAPQYHKGFKNVAQVRKELKTRTIFNILGPLLNPANPKLSIIGVYSKKLLLPIAKIVHKLNYIKTLIIHSDGVDEMTLYHSTDVIEVNNGKIFSYKLHPEDFGIKKIPKTFFIKNSSKDNYNICKHLFQSKGIIEYQYLIAMNTAILLKLFGFNNLIDNTKKALENIQNGTVHQHINNLIKRTNI